MLSYSKMARKSEAVEFFKTENPRVSFLNSILKKKTLFKLLLLIVLSTVVVWLPFAINGKMTEVFANYDGPNYVIIAKCWYNFDCIRNQFSLPLPLNYYPAHFPGYPLLIRLFNFAFPGWWAMVLVNVLATTMAAYSLYLILGQLNINKRLWLILVFLFLPARVLVLRTIGAPEMIFIAMIIFSIYYFRKNNLLASGFFLAASQTIKTPAILLFIAYLVTIFAKGVQDHKLEVKSILKNWPLLLGPAILIPIFLLFKIQTGDLLAYFHSGDNFHLLFPPFQTFISSRSWLGDIWLEDIVYLYLVGGLAVLYLYRKYRFDIVSIFPAIFWFATLFVAHRDISRYSSPLYPFWIISFAGFLKKREFKIIFLFLIPAIYLYAINFISANTAPIADWTPYR